jgi:hypothetical protein
MLIFISQYCRGDGHAQDHVRDVVIIERINKSASFVEGDFCIAAYTPDYMTFRPEALFAVGWD